MNDQAFLRNCFLIGIILGLLVSALTGCSVGVNLDAFYPKGNDPREAMPWYGGAGGDNNRNSAELHRFKKLGDQ